MSFPQLSALALELLPRSMSTISPTVFHGFVLEHGRIPPPIFVVHIHFTGANRRGSTGFLRNDLLAVKVSGSSSERTNFSTGKRLRGTRRKHSRFWRGGGMFNSKAPTLPRETRPDHCLPCSLGQRNAFTLSAIARTHPQFTIGIFGR